ncbi:histidinol-phosphate transaminase [Jatrophihabitans lederbergiae]|uniref:Histidinol-phosphate transaminase n=1 Tax=Jatrophihabitans lederbergiae TaxID=3075547 RepID=A0ABU2JI40_9ACTN|nr:histidinol-phosphate transaminase [Jatrophihabitans sp. DSM 44399]MDT0264369.1 histidinol-phosphate transaminase [Jatrophihabitans sp. DSM 44399]
MVVERSALLDVTAYRSSDAPGGGGSLELEFDLSNNELTHPPLPSVVAAIEATLSQLARYPDPTARTLTEQLAGHLSIPAENVAVGPGSAGVLQQILLALCCEGDEVVYAWPGFDAYPLLVAVCGATSLRVPLTASGEHDLDGIRLRVGPRTRVIVLCSPHNPTGTVIDTDRLQGFLRSLPEHVVTVLDEAYIEFDHCGNLPGRPAILQHHGNVVVLRTFSKAYGLAALRVGYAAGPPQVMAAVRKTALPFGVTQLAEQAAIVSLHSGAELRERMAAVAAARQQLVDGLRALQLPVLTSRANFVWVPLPSSARRFADTAASAGVKVRECPGHGVRISMGEAEAHRALLAALGRADRSQWR